MVARRKCSLEGCYAYIGPNRRIDAKYCSPEHQRRDASRRQSRRRQVEGKLVKGVDVVGRAQDTMVERLITRMISEKTDERILAGEWSQADARRFYGVTGKVMSQAVRLIRDRRIIDGKATEWEMGDEIRSMLMFNKDGSLNDYAGSYDDVEAALRWATEAADAFLTFEATFFSLPGNKPWLREPFHRVWIIETLLAIATGGYLQILSPPRHGKSELMVHLACWLIARNPDIRMIWVGGNGDIAGDMVYSVGEQLATNDKMRLACLGPGVHWAPVSRGGGTKWERKEFKVANRSTVITGSTLIAVGRGARILSRNADVIFCDDIEDFDSTQQPSARKGTRRWFGITLDSRKEEHTALIVIGSRQHIDDLYGYNLEDGNFRTIVNSAHSPDCVKDESRYSEHVECMLFPQIRSYRWLMSKKEGADSREEAGTYDLVYLNDPQADGITIFIKEEVHGCRNRGRQLGLGGLPENHRLIAGLDPSATKFQAGFLWAVAPMAGRSAKTILDAQDFLMKRWMVDLENRKGGGARNALKLLVKWFDMYGVREWVFEESGAWTGEGSLRHDLAIKKYAKANDIHIAGLETQGANKHDPLLGTGAMTRLFRDNMVDLPYGDERAKQKTNAYVRQLLRYTDDAAVQSRRKSDIHMASWLPTKSIRRMEKEALADLSSEVTALDSNYPVSYADLDGFTDTNQAPWS